MRRFIFVICISLLISVIQSGDFPIGPVIDINLGSQRLTGPVFKYLDSQGPSTKRTCFPEPPDEEDPGFGENRRKESLSSAETKFKKYDLAPDSVILNRGYWQAAFRLFGGLVFDGQNTAEYLHRVTPFVIIPTGALAGIEGDQVLKSLLERYVDLGGTIIVFTQPYDRCMQKIVPIPDGESLRFYGWKEDNSSQRNSVFFEATHPVLSSSTSGKINVGVDGYFSAYPSTSTVLLSRALNYEPTLLYYPYGDGTVILTSMFTDWASAHSRVSPAELRLVRNLIAFARNPRKPIVMYDLLENPTPKVSLSVRIKNKSDEKATHLKMTVYTPDRRLVLYTKEQKRVINPKDEIEIPVTFILPELQDRMLGICHVDCELYDTGNELVQMTSGIDSGRFAVRKLLEPFVPSSSYLPQWLTVKQDPVLWPRDIDFTVHFKNLSDQERTIDIAQPFLCVGPMCSLGKQDLNGPIQITLRPGEEKVHNFGFSTSILDFDSTRMYSFRLQYYDENGVLKQVGPAKTCWVMGPRTRSSIDLTNPWSVPAAGSLDYAVRSKHLPPVRAGNFTIMVFLEQFERYDDFTPRYKKIKTIYETRHDFGNSSQFNYNGTYTPPSPHVEGLYRLRLEVESESGSQEISRTAEFRYNRSGFHVNLGRVQKDGQAVTGDLIPGEKYSIPVLIQNFPRFQYNVKQGQYVIRLRSESGQEIFRKEVSDIAIKAGEEQHRTEFFTFQPSGLGIYVLEYCFWDETLDKQTYFLEAQKLSFKDTISLSTDKSSYEYLDVADVRVHVTGTGAYRIGFNCEEAGIAKQRDIVIESGSYNRVETFQVPIGPKPIYSAVVTVTSAPGVSITRTVRFKVNPPYMDSGVDFLEPCATAGEPVHPEVKAQLSVVEPSDRLIPVHISVENSGNESFSGRVEVMLSGTLFEEPVTVPAGDTYTGTVNIDTASLPPGEAAVDARLFDGAGALIQETAATVVLQPADIQVIGLPQELEIAAGSYGEVSLALKNQGNLRGEAVLRLSAFDTLREEREVVLEPGEELEISNIWLKVPTGTPGGTYPFFYTLEGSGIANGVLIGNFSFMVKGISLEVRAGLDADAYSVGDTAELTIDIHSDSAIETPLEAVVIGGDFSETKLFDINTADHQIVFSIPVTDARTDKVFYGIYHQGGKGIYLNDIYLRIVSRVYGVPDRQVYEPGDAVRVLFSSSEPGILTAYAFTQHHRLASSSPVSLSFPIPMTVPGGSYGISWNFVPEGTNGEELSGVVPIYVSGLSVNVARCELEKGTYLPGQEIRAAYIFESNRDETLELRCWDVRPSRNWGYLGENLVTLSKNRQVSAATRHKLITSEAGPHRLVFSLYRTSDDSAPVASGSMTFDLGNAFLVGLSTDRFEYSEGSEDVVIKADYTGSGEAALEIFQDEVLVRTLNVCIQGWGTSDIVLSGKNVVGGSHEITCLMKQQGLTSKQKVAFIYGTRLPDLSVGLRVLNSEGPTYSYQLTVTNGGKKPSAATSLVFTDNGTDVETVAVPALQAGDVFKAIFNWRRKNRTGVHELEFEVDRENVVKEFFEWNNWCKTKE